MQPLSIAVCGCGPAGLAAAILLERLGHAVTLVERFKEPQPVGSGLLLQPAGLHVLDRLGLGDAVRALGAPVTRLFGKAAPSGRIVLDVPFAPLGPGEHALGIHRSALFDALFAGVLKASVNLHTGFEIAWLDSASDHRPVLLNAAGQKLGPFGLVVDALGSRSALAESLFGPRLHRPLAWGALWASLPWPPDDFDPQALEQRYARANKMVGIMPTGKRAANGSPEATLFWSLKAKDHRLWLARGLDAWKQEVVALWPQMSGLLTKITDPGQLTFAHYGHHTLALPIARRLAVIGDAAHATSPQLGQGANMALLDAAALADALAAARDLQAGLALYARIRRWHVRLYQALSAILTPFYQSDSLLLPALRDRGFVAASALPGGSRLLAKLATGLLLDPRKELASNRSAMLTYQRS